MSNVEPDALVRFGKILADNHPDYETLAEQAERDRQSANERYREARQGSEINTFKGLVFTAASANLTEVVLEPSDQGDWMTTVGSEEIGYEDVEERLDDFAMDLPDMADSYWAILPGVFYENSRRNGDRATVNIKLAVEALLADAPAESEEKPLTHVDFARQWLAADDSPDADSDSLYTEARWEFERVVKENTPGEARVIRGQDMVGKTIASVSTETKVMRDTYKDEVTVERTYLTFTDGTTTGFGEVQMDLYTA